MQNDFISGVPGNNECRAIVPGVIKRVQKAIEDKIDIKIHIMKIICQHRREKITSTTLYKEYSWMGIYT